jgi:hypothetical protein
MIDAKRLADGLLDTVKDWVEPGFKAVREQLSDFDARIKSIPAGPQGEIGPAGPAVDQSALKAMVVYEVVRAVASLPKQPDHSVDLEEAISEFVKGLEDAA